MNFLKKIISKTVIKVIEKTATKKGSSINKSFNDLALS